MECVMVSNFMSNVGNYFVEKNIVHIYVGVHIYYDQRGVSKDYYFSDIVFS